MFNRIFNKRGAEAQDDSREHSVPAAPAPHFDLTIDDTILALDAELSSLGHMEVAQAAKERGWATLQQRLETHPVRSGSSAPLKGSGAKGSSRSGVFQPVTAGRSHGWRVALVSAGAVVAIMAVLLGTYSAGLLGGGDGSGPVASQTTQVAVTDTTASTVDTTPATGEPTTTPTTQSTPTSDEPGVTPTTQSTPTSDEPGVTPTTEGTPATSGGSGGTTRTTQHVTPTTQPEQTTTTVVPTEQQMAAAQREGDAVSAALYLGDAVLDKFMKGDLGRLPDISDSARSRLTQLIASLDDPTGCQKVAVKALSTDTVRVTLEFTDGDKSPRFFITVRVDDGGSTITDITEGS